MQELNEKNNSVIKTEFRGRLALSIEPDLSQSATQPQSFSGGFELSGNALLGSLLLYSPLGTTVAALRWSPGSARLESDGTTRQFDSIASMVQSATGADVPIASLFDWLQGNAADAPGWVADLSRVANGRVTARRTSPAPQLELRVILE